MLKLWFIQEAFLKTNYIYFSPINPMLTLNPNPVSWCSSFSSSSPSWPAWWSTSGSCTGSDNGSSLEWRSPSQWPGTQGLYFRIMSRLRQRVESRVALFKPVARYTGSLPQDHVPAQTAGRVKSGALQASGQVHRVSLPQDHVPAQTADRV